MIKFLIIGLLLYISYRIIAGRISAKKPPADHAGSRGAGVDTYLDPVCGVYVSEENAVIGRYDGQRHYFCSMNCLEKYREQLDHSSPP